MHKILLEENHKTTIEHQRRLNLIMKEVIKKDIIKWLDASIIYPICDSSWVSPVQCVPKKRVLSQRKAKILHPIYYASRTLNEAPANYTTIEKELLAIIVAFNKFRSYLVRTKVIVYTDHAATNILSRRRIQNHV
ncbi:Uncharacterized protein TCM_027580 [Theobroma cacao]|uniref:Reverse transcriptase RNase H-like domain-containing protein n=1 Tax=Theobroma cacao TaxID=3641 RepID=A0A061G8L7_THECC|nr:Uncharacterized protein TCM_027580 [Theobroma cacao]